MWKALAAVGALVLVLPVVGFRVGLAVGTSTCNDPDSEYLPCLDDKAYGAVSGGIIGLLAALALGVWIVRRYRARTAEPSGDPAALDR